VSNLKNTNSSPIAFSIDNNVEITVLNKAKKRIVKTVKTHNKATRKMVEGVLKFIEGQFTETFASPNHKPQYSGDYVKQFIPCYFNVGYGGVIIDEETGQQESEDISEKHVPKLDPNWNELVPYTATRLLKEYSLSGSDPSNRRSKIRYQNYYDGKALDTITQQNPPAGDMDSVIFVCEMSPNCINPDFQNNPVYVTELGLFAGVISKQPDLLAYVKLGNLNNNTDTNALYIKPADTIIVKWVITIAAIGKDNILQATVKDDDGQQVHSELIIPEIGSMEIEEYPNQ
jgi:hypothetical protein